MTGSAQIRVAIVGCGVISRTYAHTISQFEFMELAACVDAEPDRAEALGAPYGADARTLDEVLGDPAIDAIVNGSGGFVFAFTNSAGIIPVSVTAVDLNGDGKMDVICANNTSSGTLTALTNDGAGGLEPVLKFREVLFSPKRQTG